MYGIRSPKTCSKCMNIRGGCLKGIKDINKTGCNQQGFRQQPLNPSTLLPSLSSPKSSWHRICVNWDKNEMYDTRGVARITTSHHNSTHATTIYNTFNHQRVTSCLLWCLQAKRKHDWTPPWFLLSLIAMTGWIPQHSGMPLEQLRAKAYCTETLSVIMALLRYAAAKRWPLRSRSARPMSLATKQIMLWQISADTLLFRTGPCILSLCRPCLSCSISSLDGLGGVLSQQPSPTFAGSAAVSPLWAVFSSFQARANLPTTVSVWEEHGHKGPSKERPASHPASCGRVSSGRACGTSQKTRVVPAPHRWHASGEWAPGMLPGFSQSNWRFWWALISDLLQSQSCLCSSCGRKRTGIWTGSREALPWWNHGRGVSIQWSGDPRSHCDKLNRIGDSKAHPRHCCGSHCASTHSLSPCFSQRDPTSEGLEHLAIGLWKSSIPACASKPQNDLPMGSWTLCRHSCQQQPASTRC